MQLDSRKKSRLDCMMRLKSFETQEVRDIGRKKAGELRGFSLPIDGNSRGCLADARKGMQSSGKIEDRKKKIHTRARKML